MKKALKALITLALGATICLSVAGCGGGGSGSGGGTGGGGTSLQNKDKSFAMVTTWTASGLVNHYDSNTNCEAFDYFVVEGLYRYVRSTDEIYCQLAGEKLVHSKAPMEDFKEEMGQEAYDYFASMGCTEVPVSTAKIRSDAKWQNGEAFTAKDVWAYYYIMHPTSSNYMAAVVAADTDTVKFVWNPLKEPNNTVKELLVAQDKSGTVKYDEFSSYVDVLYDIVMHSPVNKNLNMWGAFNRWSTQDQIVQMNKTKNAFFAYSPSWYVATGPFKLDKFSATQILLTKNKYYWNADNIGFERIKLYSSSDLNQTYQLVTNGYVDYLDGFIHKDTLESMLEQNKSLINLKMYDPGSIGIVFNLENRLFTLGVRKAFQYIFNREEVKLAANPYGETSYYPLTGMAISEAKRYMSKDHFNALTKYSYDVAKAEQLLKAEGWTKTDGKWYANGSQVRLALGAPSTHGISSMAAEAAAAQLEAFGIKVDLLKSSNYYANATADHSPYDLMLEWTDLNMSFSYPTGSYNQFSNIYSHWAHVERYDPEYEDPQKANNVKLVFDGLDGDTKKYEFAEYINSFYSVDENELSYLVDVFNTGLSNLCLGIQFFQNVTASTLNASRIAGIPLESYWTENRNVTYVPEVGTQEFFDVAKTNLNFTCDYMFAYGVYQPK